jgi:hypothetical protein
MAYGSKTPTIYISIMIAGLGAGDIKSQERRNRIYEAER